MEGCDDEREIIGGDEEVMETWLACCGFKIPAMKNAIKYVLIYNVYKCETKYDCNILIFFTCCDMVYH